jgi:hypothetical protein
MAKLREAAFTVEPGALDAAPTPELPHAFGALMETGFDVAAATLAVFADGTVSLYFSNGGGVIGAGSHDAVRASAARLLASAERHLSVLAPVAQTPPPPPLPGRVRLYVRCFDGTRGAEAAESELAALDHPLAGLFRAAHAVITEMRRQTPPPAAPPRQ